jgi:hypothetical protein
MSKREQPDPGEGWRLASGDDCKDHRCEQWITGERRWKLRPGTWPGNEFVLGVIYRIPDDAPQPDLVNAPPHYRQGDIECIDAIRSALTDEEFRGYVKGNAIKYLWREKHKGGDEDLKKAAWYLSRIETKEFTK